MKGMEKFFFIIAVLVASLAVASGIWVTFFAKCTDLGFVPAYNLPSRCINLLKP